MTILFVCTGNTCRSPMAQALATVAFNAQGKTITTTSAGIAADAGAPISSNAVAALAALGLENAAQQAASHTAHTITAQMVADADFIITMTHGHKRHLLHLYPSAADKTHTMHQLTGNETRDVGDPFMQGLDVYVRCATEMYQTITHIAEVMT